MEGFSQRCRSASLLSASWRLFWGDARRTPVRVLAFAGIAGRVGGRVGRWLRLRPHHLSVAHRCELVPKQMALRAPEAVAAKVAPAMTILSKVALPLVWLLHSSGKLVLSLLGQSGKTGDSVT
jgi:hypothetical protein